MALRTNVHIQYRTPYMPGTKLPLDVEKLMRKEISAMRKDLLQKQERLKKHKKYSHSERLVNELSGIRVNELNTTAKVWNTWNRLRSLELSNQTSVTGKNLTMSRSIESLHQAGYSGINESNYDEFAKTMGEVKERFQALLWDSEQVVNIFLEYYNSDPEFRHMNPMERYQVMTRIMLDEINDKWRDYNTPYKVSQGIKQTMDMMEKTHFGRRFRIDEEMWEYGFDFDTQSQTYKYDPAHDSHRNEYRLYQEKGKSKGKKKKK